MTPAPGDPPDVALLARGAGLEGGGETGALIRSLSWDTTAVGAIAGWPQSLKTTVGMLLQSRHPMFLWWGPQLTQFYNDAYLPSLGTTRHPKAMGQPGRDCWGESWPSIGPQIDEVMSRGQPSWNEDHLVPFFRNGRVEEIYWTYGYSPVFDEQGAIGGTLVVCIETSARVIAERRLNTIRRLAEKTALALDHTELLRSAAAVFAQAPSDIPFAAIYGLDRDADAPQLLQAVGLPAEQAAALATTTPLVERALADAVIRAAPLRITTPTPLPGGPWPEPAAELLVAPLGQPDARPWGFVVFGLSPRLPFGADYHAHLHQLTAQLGSAHARLDAIVVRAAADAERTNLLEKAQAEREKLLSDLEAASRAKDEFLAMLGHELRNPLAPIVTALQLLKLRDGDQLSSEHKTIERQVSHLVRLVDDLLDVSRITRGKVELKRELVEVSEVLTRAVEMASFLFEQRNHQLDLDVPRTGLRWHGDPMRLAQSVANLLTNAARYTKNGGKIVLRAAREGSELVIRVQDNGIGISAELLPRVFDLFVQGQRSADRAEGGLGIGLTLVKNLITAHGGVVTGSSAGLGRGSEFTIRLPATETVPLVSPPVATAPVARKATSKRVLVVDDNADAADLLADLLRTVGHQVALALDPLAALNLVDDFQPEVAVLDIGLPVMDGYELAKRLRARLTPSACRLIALTGYGQDHDRQRSAEAGFASHLVKPVDIPTLLRLIAAP